MSAAPAVLHLSDKPNHEKGHRWMTAVQEVIKRFQGSAG